jgi:TonB family protein
MHLRALVCLSVAVVVGACGAGDAAPRRAPRPLGGDRPDEPPVMVNRDLPFRYPPPLYARRVQANVVLRLYIDRDGRVFPDSTRVEESSGHSALDSAAVRGSQELHFIPAKLHGEPMGVAVLFPVYFRHPEAPPLPGDTLLAKRGARPDSSRTP